MRVVDWNIEHMNSWIVPNSDPTSPALRASFPGSRFGGGPIDDVPALAQLDRKRQHPLAHGYSGYDVIDQVGGGLHHAPRTTLK